MNKKRLYVDIHVLQTVPPSCINRDDTGSPKTAVYGGVTRARVSSQAWKRAMRQAFKDLFPQEKLGLRTKRITSLVVEELEKLGMEGDVEKAAIKALETADLKIKASSEGTGAMFFISRAQATALAELAYNQLSETDAEMSTREMRAQAQTALSQNPGIDIALFGRMVADDPSLNTDASAQVAHAIGTHRVANEYDYFTAVDDLPDQDHAGAAHIGTVEFNSATLYRYATVAVHQLETQLGDDTPEAVTGFIKAFALSMPTGKQNTFANRTLPDALLLTIREDQPINLVGAFESPVRAGEGGYIKPSVHRLAEHAQAVYRDFAGQPAVSLVVGEGLSSLGERLSLNELLDKTEKELRARRSSKEEEA